MTENKTVDDSIVFYLSNQVMTLQDKITKLEQALAVAEEALKIYGDKENWSGYKFYPEEKYDVYESIDGFSFIASNAIEKINDIKKGKQDE